MLIRIERREVGDGIIEVDQFAVFEHLTVLQDPAVHDLHRGEPLLAVQQLRIFLRDIHGAIARDKMRDIISAFLYILMNRLGNHPFIQIRKELHGNKGRFNLDLLVVDEAHALEGPDITLAVENPLGGCRRFFPFQVDDLGFDVLELLLLKGVGDQGTLGDRIGDENPRTLYNVDAPDVEELLQRFPDRIARHPILVGKLPFRRELAARRILILIDLAQQVIGDEFPLLHLILSFR